jgi:6-pyruvoyltetrahydropterin/6-carboxytetrahydropterin synthase
MLIRKLFKFENAHIVRGCTSRRCRESLHGHSYKIEVFIHSNYLDNGQMVYDFGLTKQYIKDLIDSFDHSISLWSGDDKNYISDMKKYSERWIELPVSPSAEQLSRIIFFMVDKILEQTQMINGEKQVKTHSVIVHETDTGYAQCFRDDVYNQNMGELNFNNIIFSNGIKNEWKDSELWEKLKNKAIFKNPKSL